MPVSSTFSLCGLVLESRSLSVDRLAFCILQGPVYCQIGSPRTLNISSQGLLSYRDGDGPTCADSPSIPLTRPSVGPIAIHLTVSSPRCWETSTTSFPPCFVIISMASLISGRCPSLNLISETAPIIWVIFPV